MTTTASFITSLLTSFIVFCVLLVVFAILSRRPGNFNIYYPLRVLRGEGPFAKKRGAFGWIKEAYLASEEDLVAIAGLDATVYIHLFTTGMHVCCCGSLQKGKERKENNRQTNKQTNSGVAFFFRPLRLLVS